MSISWSIDKYDTLPSTQNTLIHHSNLREGLVVHTLSQDNGKGRHGREWIGARGNLFISFALQPALEPARFGQISLAVGLAVLRTIKGLMPKSDVVLKWPNDVFLNTKKVSGILIDSHITPHDSTPILIIGVGVNLNSVPDERFTSLNNGSADVLDVDDFRDQLLQNFGHVYDQLCDQGFERLKEEWLHNSYSKGQKIGVNIGKRRHNGQFVDIDSLGHLRLICGDEKVVKTISSGDVFLI